MSAMLELIDFKYHYGGVQAVKGIDLQIQQGEIVTLIGANGAGKSTTMRSISGLTDPNGVQGKILFEGKEIQKMSGHKIAKMGLSHVIEGRHIFGKLTVDENLEMGAYLRKDTKNIRADKEDMYHLFPRLLERKTSLGSNLSGGEQQMLAIARVLMNHPKMILLDEPSLGLAPIIVTEVFKAIKRLNEENGITIFFVEQNSQIALNSAKRGYVMQTGEIVVSGTCEELLSNENVRRAYLGA